MADPPRLIGSIGTVNLVAWNGSVWRVPQSLGPLDLDNPEHRRRPGITEHPTEAAARAGVSTRPGPAARPQPPRPAAPAPAAAGIWPVTWWCHTGEMSPFIDGISSPILENVATGERLISRDLPMGACFAMPREAGLGPHDYPRVGADGLSVVCVVPSSGYESGKTRWRIDGYASNCTSPCRVCGVQRKDHTASLKDSGHPYEDSVPEHRCWVRHGTVGEPIHVDKNGLTCQAGGGSIQTEGWHGFLHRGVLKP